MNVWRRGSLTENPYYRTAFRVGRVPRDVVRHRTVVQLLGQTRRIVAADPQAHTVHSEPVTDAMLNAAEQVLLDPKQRIVEELLEHAPEEPPLERVRQLAQQAAALLAADDDGPPVPGNLEVLRPWAGALVEQFLEAVPGPDPSFGALELDLVPPFGRPGEE